MKKDTYITEVLFRFWKGTILALFPYIIEDRSGGVMSYLHVGQHGSADYKGCIKNSRPATNKEYADLKAELGGRGYNLLVVKKQNYNRYLKEYRKMRDRK